MSRRRGGSSGCSNTSVGAVYDRALFLESTKYARSQTAPADVQLLTIPLRERPLHRLDAFHAENPVGIDVAIQQVSLRTLIMESFKMEYLFVVIALVSVGSIFAGL